MLTPEEGIYETSKLSTSALTRIQVCNNQQCRKMDMFIPCLNRLLNRLILLLSSAVGYCGHKNEDPPSPPPPQKKRVGAQGYQRFPLLWAWPEYVADLRSMLDLPSLLLLAYFLQSSAGSFYFIFSKNLSKIRLNNVWNCD